MQREDPAEPAAAISSALVDDSLYEECAKEPSGGAGTTPGNARPSRYSRSSTGSAKNCARSDRAFSRTPRRAHPRYARVRTHAFGPRRHRSGARSSSDATASANAPGKSETTMCAGVQPGDCRQARCHHREPDRPVLQRLQRETAHVEPRVVVGQQADRGMCEVGRQGLERQLADPLDVRAWTGVRRPNRRPTAASARRPAAERRARPRRAGSRHRCGRRPAP